MPLSSTTWLRGRSVGVLAHLSSLPGPFGIGNLGTAARDFIDFLATHGMRYWQLCPLGPTGYGDSPYQSFSSFAGNPYFLDLEELANAGLLTTDELLPLRSLPTEQVDYGRLYELFWETLERAAQRFLLRPRSLPQFGDWEEFRARHRRWVEPFAQFMALKKFHGGVAWPEWEPRFRNGPNRAAMHLPSEAIDEAERHVFYQYVFEGQWSRLRAYAAGKQVQIIGDLPIFVALDSADTWQWRHAFRLDASGQPLASAGVPPDYFSAFGQFWGNPLYDWEALAEDGYGWWIERLRRAFDLYDVIRLDHFRGFDTYWEIPAGSEDARNGQWREGPGMDFFQHVARELPEARIIAEDLGYITEGVVDLRRAAGYPGMKILQFAYGHDDNNVNLAHFHTPDSVVYTGTHDNNTVRGWLAQLPPDCAARVREYYQWGEDESAWPLIRAAYASPSRLAVIPMQDLLDLGSEARMNRPGTSEGNWRWRFSAAQLNDLAARHGDRLRHWCALFDRDGDPRQREYSAPPEEPADARESLPLN